MGIRSTGGLSCRSASWQGRPDLNRGRRDQNPVFWPTELRPVGTPTQNRSARRVLGCPVATVQGVEGLGQRMAAAAQGAQVVDVVIESVPIDVVYLCRRVTQRWVDLLPATLRTGASKAISVSGFGLDRQTPHVCGDSRVAAVKPVAVVISGPALLIASARAELVLGQIATAVPAARPLLLASSGVVEDRRAGMRAEPLSVPRA